MEFSLVMQRWMPEDNSHNATIDKQQTTWGFIIVFTSRRTVANRIQTLCKIINNHQIPKVAHKQLPQ